MVFAPMNDTRILLVDDEATFCEQLKSYLDSCGFTVAMAHSGEEGIEKAAEFRPHLVLLDIRMPGMGGMNALTVMKNRWADLPILLLTAEDNLDSAIAAFKNGAAGYLRKPVNLEELSFMVKKEVENTRRVIHHREYIKDLESRFAKQGADLKAMYLELKKAFIDIVQTLAATIELKDPYTRGHCNRVTLLSIRIGRALGLSEKELEILEYGALLHDIGKIGIRGAVLNKSGPLTDEEYEHIKSHPVLGAEILEKVSYLSASIHIVRHHHERYDGAGYPDHQRGIKLDLMSQIVMLADAYDAMTSSRPYRPGMALERALEIVKSERGKQFNPELVDLFINKMLYEMGDTYPATFQ